MRVALIVPGFSANADARIPALATLIGELSEALELHVFPLAQNTHADRYIYGKAMVHPIGGLHMQFRNLLPMALGRIRQVHRARPFDAVHGIWLFESGAIAVLTGKLFGVSSVASLGGAEVARFPGIKYGGQLNARDRFIHRQVLTHASLVTGGSAYVLDLARQTVPQRRPAVFALAPLPVNTDAFNFSLPPAGNPQVFSILHVGAFLPVKDQLMLIQAFSHIARELPSARLKLIGEDPIGYRAQVERKVNDLGLDQLVQLCDRRPHAELKRLYRDADLFVQSSRHESQGMAVLEAAASGVPILGSRVGAVADLAPQAARSVCPGEPAALAAAALQLYQEPEERQRLALAASERVATTYGTVPAVQRFVELYQLLVEGT